MILGKAISRTMYPDEQRITAADLAAVRSAIQAKYRPLIVDLSDRQRELLELMAHGLSKTECANSLGMASIGLLSAGLMQGLYLGVTRADFAVAIAAYWCCRGSQ